MEVTGFWKGLGGEEILGREVRAWVADPDSGGRVELV